MQSAVLRVCGPRSDYCFLFSTQGLVIAGLSDLSRPADQLSIGQSGSLAATGLIWSRYSLVIIPKNWGLFSVNVFVAISSCAQLGRAYLYKKEQDEKLALEQKQQTNETKTLAIEAAPSK